MSNPRDILNKIKWQNNPQLRNVEITIIHRGAPNNIRSIPGENIKKIEKTFMVTTTASIPYHRIIKITYNSEIIFKRKKNV